MNRQYIARSLLSRRFVQGAGVVGLALVTKCDRFPPQAKPPAIIPRIGYLSPADPATDSTRAEGIRLALRERGFLEGQNIVIEYRYAEGKVERQAELAAELARLKVAAIMVAGGDTVIQAAKDATETIPIVMTAGGGDPVEAGFIDSLARPGGNVTGLTTLTGELGGKRLELFKEAVPTLVRVAVLYDATLAPQLLQVQDLQMAARPLGLTIQPFEVRGTEDFVRVFAELRKQLSDGLYVIQGRLMTANAPRLVDFALKSRLPSVYNSRDDVEAGGLMSYGADRAHIYGRVAYYVDMILKGAKPADLPVEQPMRFDFVINLRTAQALGLTIPQHVLLQATEVIQ
ncbi:MAG TPA: ABC transporter substrate-binding protein [Chloroflexota bacterium]|jgi:putative ABC transport system substrate-binding protein